MLSPPLRLNKLAFEQTQNGCSMQLANRQRRDTLAGGNIHTTCAHRLDLKSPEKRQTNGSFERERERERETGAISPFIDLAIVVHNKLFSGSITAN